MPCHATLRPPPQNTKIGGRGLQHSTDLAGTGDWSSPLGGPLARPGDATLGQRFVCAALGTGDVACICLLQSIAEDVCMYFFSTIDFLSVYPLIDHDSIVFADEVYTSEI